jgi:thiol:disulfide interchange protein DsbG
VNNLCPIFYTNALLYRFPGFQGKIFPAILHKDIIASAKNNHKADFFMMQGLKSPLTALLIICVLPVSAGAQGVDNRPPLPDALDNLVKEGAQVRYLGDKHGMDGWLMIKNGQPQYFYVAPDGQAILTGLMFNSEGDNVTARQLQALRGEEGKSLDALTQSADKSGFEMPEVRQPKSRSEKMYSAIKASNWFVLGQPQAPVVYAFIDPQCPHCHDFINTLRDRGLIENGRVQLRVIPVAVINKQSLYQSAYLLAASDPSGRLLSHIDGEESLPVQRDMNTQGVQRNMTVMKDWGLKSTPFVVYKDKGGEVRVIQGNPDDTAGLVKELPSQ